MSPRYRCSRSYGLGEISGAHVLRQGRMLPLEGQVHLPGDAAVAEMAGWAGSQLGDVLCFSEVHLEEAADPGGEGRQVERGLRRLGWFPGRAGAAEFAASIAASYLATIPASTRPAA